MAVAVKCTGVDETRKNRRRSFALTLSGSYVTSGDTVNFTTLNKNGFSRAIPPSNPLFNQDSVEINAVPNGYEAYLVQRRLQPHSVKLPAENQHDSQYRTGCRGLSGSLDWATH